jgi:flagellin
MALTVATNTGALMAQAAASSVNKEMEISMERLSTGKRINAASDDAAGVAIASRLSAEIRGTNQAIRNAMDGQAMLDTAEGAHVEVENILQRMRELAVQSANDTNDANDRANLQLEIDQLITEIDRIASTTTWAGQNLVDGTGDFTFQVGSKTTASDLISTSINAMTSAGIGVDAPDAADEVTVVNGGSMSSAGVLTYTDNTASTVQFGGQNFTLDFAITNHTGGVAATTYNTGTITFNSGSTASLKINGITIEAAHVTNATATETALASAFTTAQTNNAEALGHITFTAGGAGVFTITASKTDKATKMEALLEANSSFNDKFSISSASGVSTFTANSAIPSVSQAASTFTEYGSVSTDPVSTVSSNVITFTTESTAATASNYSTQTYTVNGTDISFNTWTDGTNAGFDINSVTGLASALKAKLEASSVGVTVTQSAGQLTLSTGGSVSVNTAANARIAIDRIDAAIQTVNSQRATLGAVSNRLDNTVSNLTNISSNLQAGRGRIEDADFAAETTNLAKTQILQQASTAMLAQANAAKQNVLSLLQG